MTENRTPAFCGRCGTKLVPNEDIQGYDVFSGEALKTTELRCPNPDVTTTTPWFGKGETTYTYHPRWSNVNGNWDQY